MTKIYVGQTKLKLYCDVGIDITGATSTKIKYKKPDRSTGEFIAVIDDGPNGVLLYQIQNATDLDQNGEWILWASVIFSDSKTAEGQPYVIEVFKPGT